MASVKGPRKLGRRWIRTDFEIDPVQCARNLIGTTLIWNGCAGRVVETEAYADGGDEAAVQFLNKSGNAFIDSNSAGTIFVYKNYGVHRLLNILTKHSSRNGFVLIRAVEPLRGMDQMQERRGRNRTRDLCSGPGKLCQALGITDAHHQESLVERQGRGIYGDSTDDVESDTRIGITKGTDLPWRFLLKGNSYVSRSKSS